jgi:transcriptional regulator with XRE-family HTH domain
MYPNLKLQLWKCGLRQNRLAKMLGMDETALSRIVNGFRQPSLEVRNSIATLLGCDADWLFHAEQDHTTPGGYGTEDKISSITAKSAGRGDL